MAKKANVVIKGVSVEFNQRQVLSDLSLTFVNGEFVSVLGVSGCGKTTLLRALSGEVPLKSGTISGCERFGYAQQDAPFFPWLNILENLALAAPKFDQRLAEDFLKRLDLIEIAQLKPYQISGGMKSRVNLLRAFISSPDIVLMDEPFSHLDIITKEHLHFETTKFWDENKCSVLFVTHDLDEAIRLSDRIIVLSRNGAKPVLDLKNPIGRPRSSHSLHNQQNQEYKSLWLEIEAALK